MIKSRKSHFDSVVHNQRTFVSLMLAALLGALSLFAAASAVAQTVDPVTNLTATAGDGKLTVSWTNPSSSTSGGHAIVLRWKVQGTSTWLNVGGALGRRPSQFISSYEITDLTGGTTYVVEVRIYRATGQIGFSSWVSTTGTPLRPTVTLSASPNPVDEGSEVTVRATLSRALSSNVTIPLTITDNSAESGDHGTLSSITINSGSTSGTGTISTNHDTDEDNETFTVALGTLPSEVTAGSPSSVQITIRDDEGVQILTVDASPPCGSTVTDMSLHPTYTLTLTPAPGAEVRLERRVVTTGNTEGWIRTSSIPPSGRLSTARNTFAGLRNGYPGFEGFEFRLANDRGVTARCTWTFDPRDDDRTSNPMPPQPPPDPPTGRPPTGGGSPPGAPSDPAPDSPSCGEDREELESFYEASGGDNWLEKENWNSEEPLVEWHGVGTDEDGNVVSLRLPDNNLSGKMPTAELLCLKELVELALWGNDDLSGEVPDELVLAVERAVLRDIAEMLNIYPEWFEDYGDPYDFEDWHEGVTTDEEGRVTGLDFTGEGVTGEIPENIFELLPRLGEIMVTRSSEDGGCALSPEGSSAFSLFLLTLFVFAALVRKRARRD